MMQVDTHKFHTIQNNYTTPCQAKVLQTNNVNTIGKIKQQNSIQKT